VIADAERLAHVAAQLCASRPAEWWDIEDGGARLALLLCRVCPQLQRCSSTAGDEHGVIRAGVAYGNDGKPLPICGCGYPNRHRIAWRTKKRPPLCHRCVVPSIRTPRTRVSRARSECATAAGAQAHRYRKEPICDPCREAEREYMREYKRARRAA
jgi:hypothetical protein